jgi:hypothetical protein
MYKWSHVLEGSKSTDMTKPEPDFRTMHKSTEMTDEGEKRGTRSLIPFPRGLEKSIHDRKTPVLGQLITGSRRGLRFPIMIRDLERFKVIQHCRILFDRWWGDGRQRDSSKNLTH